jgi:hypothetical protein
LRSSGFVLVVDEQLRVFPQIARAELSLESGALALRVLPIVGVGADVSG